MHRRLLDLRSREPVHVATPHAAPAPVAPPSTPSTPPTPPSTRVIADIETQLIDIIVAAPPPGFTVAAAHAAKEQALAIVLAELSAWQAWHLHKRLVNQRQEDPLARAFSRIIPARRARLLAFLGDARRREALQTTNKAR
jgi:hypothetical protein